MPRIDTLAAMLAVSAVAFVPVVAQQPTSDGKAQVYDKQCLAALVRPDAFVRQAHFLLCDCDGCPGDLVPEGFFEVRFFSPGSNGKELHAQIPGYDYCLTVDNGFLSLDLSALHKCAETYTKVAEGAPGDWWMIVDPEDGSEGCVQPVPSGFALHPPLDGGGLGCSPFWSSPPVPEPLMLGDYQQLTEQDEVWRLTSLIHPGQTGAALLLCPDWGCPGYPDFELVNSWSLGGAGDFNQMTAQVSGLTYCLIAYYDDEQQRYFTQVELASVGRCVENYISAGGLWLIRVTDGPSQGEMCVHTSFDSDVESWSLFSDMSCKEGWMRKKVPTQVYMIV